MKHLKLFLILAVLLPSIAFGGMTVFHQVAFISSSSACSTPTGYDFIEGFEGTGYENTGYSTTGSGTVDEDATRPGTQSPTGLCSESLSITTDSGNNTYVTVDTGLELSEAYIRIYIYPDTLPSGYYTYAFYCGGSATWDLAFALQWATDSVLLRGRGDTDSGYVTLTTDQWNYVDVHFVQNGTCTLSANGGTEVSFTGNDRPIEYFSVGWGSYAPTETMRIYYDLIIIDSEEI